MQGDMRILPSLLTGLLPLSLATTGCFEAAAPPTDDPATPDAGAEADAPPPDAPDAPPPGDRFAYALGRWTLDVDRGDCGPPVELGVKLWRDRDVLLFQLDGRTLEFAGGRLLEAGGELRFFTDAADWLVVLRDDGANARAVVGWSDGTCTISREARVRTRERPDTISE